MSSGFHFLYAGPFTKVTIFRDREEKLKSVFVCFDPPRIQILGFAK